MELAEIDLIGLIPFLQLFSRCQLVRVFITAEVPFTVQPQAEENSYRRHLLLECESAPDPELNRSFTYKVRLPDVLPGMLNGAETEFDPASVLGQGVITNLLPKTTDMRGNPFARVLRGLVIQF